MDGPVLFFNTTCCPGPPRNCPAPPESGRMRRSSTATPVSSSHISLDIIAQFVGAGVVCRPSSPAMAPIPPVAKYWSSNLPPFRNVPLNTTAVAIPGSAWTASGSALAKAPISSGTTYQPTVLRPGWPPGVERSGYSLPGPSLPGATRWQGCLVWTGWSGISGCMRTRNGYSRAGR